MRIKILHLLALLVLLPRMGSWAIDGPEAEAEGVSQPAAVVRGQTKKVVERPGKGAGVEPQVKFRYPVNISPAGPVPPSMEWTREADGTYVVTVIGRIYLWQKQEKGGLLELQADGAVIWYSEEALKAFEEAREAGKVQDFEDFLASGVIPAIYMSGDVVMTQGQRTVEADEMYYDFEAKKALAINTVMRNFDVKRGIPIYIRAAKMRQLGENQFAAEDFTMTSSEFHLPQVSVGASNVVVTDTTGVDEHEGSVPDSSYDAQMKDVRFKWGETTVFYWPFFRSNLQRPDVPLKSVHAGYDSDWGALIETRWYLSRLLGLQEPEDTEGTFMLDYYSDRGVGTGVEVDYAREDCFGRLLGYVINDKGEDDLGRDDSRRNLEPPRELRGRFSWQHRQFLPYNWQLTSEVSYLSDENFLESYYRNEFNADKEQETLVHLKRIEDNWGLSLLGKGRINDFDDEVEEAPSVEYHLTGQSLLDDKLTFYSDSQASRFRERLATGSPSVSEKFFTFASERAELDMPTRVGRMKVVPFVAGTVAYEDGDGFRTDLDGVTRGSEKEVWMGEVGARASIQYWKVFPGVKSQLWGLNQLRHVVRPHMTAVSYAESESVVEQRDTLSVGVSQRLQTKRGTFENERTVDWMRLDLDVTWVNNSGDPSAGPDQFMWNKPFIPLVDTYSTAVPPQDRRSSDIFGPRRNYVGADYLWRLSDTTALLSDMNYDMQSGVVQQFNIGFSRLRWPNLSYYVGSRYLRRVEVLGEEGSNAFTFAATYVLDPRYTVVFSQQYDFDYGANIRSDITLIRRYHRVYWGLTFSADESLKKQAIVFSIWPQGVPELGIGPRRYMKLGDSADY
ncbi:MAG: LPS assembly protein LptD [Planctomycetota bacterium]